VSRCSERQPTKSTLSNRTSAVADTLALSWDSGTGVGCTLATRACSEGDVLAGVDAPDSAGRSSRLLSCASTLFGRLLTPTTTRQRLTTVSGVEWRRRHESKQHYRSSNSFHDSSAATSIRDCQHQSTQTVAAAVGGDELDVVAITPGEARLPSSSGSSRRHSQRRAANTPTPMLDAAAASDTWNRPVLQRTRSSKKRPAVRRYPSMERLDLPPRRAAATLMSGKRAERFRRQYIDVKLRQPAGTTPTLTTKSMPSGVDVCGTTRHSSLLLAVPATANIVLTQGAI